MGNVKISDNLYQLLVDYHLHGQTESWREIKRELEQKEKARKAHNLYTKSKSKAETDEERKRARQEYLDWQGVSESFRW